MKLNTDESKNDERIALNVVPPMFGNEPTDEQTTVGTARKVRNRRTGKPVTVVRNIRPARVAKKGRVGRGRGF